MAKLLKALGASGGINLKFVDLIQDETRDGQPLITLVLETPISKVLGRNLTDAASGERIRLEANDVETVTIGPDAILALDTLTDLADADGKPENEPFQWAVQGKSGTLKCDLKMDVSNALSVFIVTEKFAAFASRKRNERNTLQKSGLVQKLKDNKTKQEFKGTDVENLIPEPVTK